MDNTKYANGIMKEYVLARHLVDMAWECKDDWLTDEMIQNSDWVLQDIVQHGIDYELDNVIEDIELARKTYNEDQYGKYLDAIKWAYIGVMAEKIANNGGVE